MHTTRSSGDDDPKPDAGPDLHGGPEIESFERLLNNARQGHSGAANALLEWIYRSDSPAIRALRALQNRVDFNGAGMSSVDVLHSVLLQSVLTVEQFQGETEIQFAAWMRTIAARKVLNRVQRKKRETLQDPQVAEWQSEDMEQLAVQIAQEIETGFQERLASIAPKCREAFGYWAGGVKAQDGAKALGMSVSGYNKKIRQAKDALGLPKRAPKSSPANPSGEPSSPPEPEREPGGPQS